METLQHKEAPKGHIHIIHNNEFATLEDRDKFVPTIEDLDKICLIRTPYSHYALSSLNPIKWERVGGEEKKPTKISNFSESETLTGERWIDGKPIYRKVEIFPAPKSGNSVTITYPDANFINNNAKVQVDEAPTYYNATQAGIDSLGKRMFSIFFRENKAIFYTDVNTTLYGKVILVLYYTKNLDTAQTTA